MKRGTELAPGTGNAPDLPKGTGNPVPLGITRGPSLKSLGGNQGPVLRMTEPHEGLALHHVATGRPAEDPPLEDTLLGAVRPLAGGVDAAAVLLHVTPSREADPLAGLKNDVGARNPLAGKRNRSMRRISGQAPMEIGPDSSRLSRRGTGSRSGNPLCRGMPDGRRMGQLASLSTLCTRLSKPIIAIIS